MLSGHSGRMFSKREVRCKGWWTRETGRHFTKACGVHTNFSPLRSSEVGLFQSARRVWPSASEQQRNWRKVLPRVLRVVVLSERLESKEPMKPGTRRGPWVPAGHTRVPPPVPNTKRQTAGQRVRRARRSRRGEESNLKTLSHNHGKFFTFMLY